MSRTAVVAGVGPGLGASLARKFAHEGCRVGLLARSVDFAGALVAELEQSGTSALAVPTDITDPEQVAQSFARVRDQLGPVDILVNHAGNAAWKDFFGLTPEDLERAWRVCAYGSFLCCKEAVPDMFDKGGAILFTGATSSIRGRAGGLAFSSAKFAVRGLAEALARELWPKGIHVAHVIIDGVLDTPGIRTQDPSITDEPLLDTDAAADSYWGLIQQDRGGWTFEIDLRPHDEEFFV